MITEALRAMQDGANTGVIVLERSGDLAAEVACRARSVGVRVAHIDPARDDSDALNPLVGPATEVAEAVSTALHAAFGEAACFFLPEEYATRGTVRLLKLLEGNDVTLSEIISNLRSPAELRANVTRLHAAGHDDAADYFEEALWGPRADEVRDRAHAFLDRAMRNSRSVLEGDASVDLPRVLGEGRWVLTIATGTLAGREGKFFGRLMEMSLEYAIRRRPEPHAGRAPFILYVDKASNKHLMDTLCLFGSYNVKPVLI